MTLTCKTCRKTVPALSPDGSCVNCWIESVTDDLVGMGLNLRHGRPLPGYNPFDSLDDVIAHVMMIQDLLIASEAPSCL